MGFLLDIIVVAIIALTAFLAARRGFVRTFIEVVGFFLSIYLAFALSGSLAQVTYDKAVEPSVVGTIENAIGETTLNVSETTINQIWDEIPQFLTAMAEKNGLTKSTLSQEVQRFTDHSGAGIAQVAADFVEPAIVSILRVLFGVLIFIVLLILIKFLAKFINRVFKLPLVGSLNTVLGAVLGVAKGFIYAFLICTVLSALAVVLKDGFLIFTPKAIESSFLFKWLASLSPLF